MDQEVLDTSIKDQDVSFDWCIQSQKTSYPITICLHQMSDTSLTYNFALYCQYQHHTDVAINSESY